MLLKVIKCKLLTTYEEARSLTFKVTIRGCDRDKSRNQESWPNGVTVSLFRERNSVSRIKRSSDLTSSISGRRQPDMEMTQRKAINQKESVNQNKSPKKSVRFSDQVDWLLQSNHF